jgi:co-chaperonin GroES (HSP10)
MRSEGERIRLGLTSGGQKLEELEAARAAQIAIENESGIVPVEFRVLVKPSDVDVDPALARAKAAGLKLPPDVLERELMAQIVAELVAVGGNAFEDWKPPIPKVGDTVLIAKYAGITVKGADEVEYRMLHDKDISGVITKPGVSRGI